MHSNYYDAVAAASREVIGYVRGIQNDKKRLEAWAELQEPDQLAFLERLFRAHVLNSARFMPVPEKPDAQ